jgi:putative tryptophan/tyrosine transport system substrate-binding protein
MAMDKRILEIVTLLMFLLSGGCAKQEAQKVYHVGILSGVESFFPAVDNFKAKMTELGYIEGQNIVYDLRRLDDDPAGEKRIAGEFVANKVDLIFAFPTEAALSVKAATKGTAIPMIFGWSQIEGVDLVESVSHPGGNITGVRHHVGDMMLKRFEFLLKLVPDAKRIWMVYDPRITAAADSLKLIRPLAASCGVTLVETLIASKEEFEAELKKRAALSDSGIDAIMLMPDANSNSPTGFALISAFAAARKIPISALVPWEVNTGALFTFTPTATNIGSLSAILADKILKGIPAGTIPLVTVDGSLVINYRVAQNLGLKIDEGTLSMAEEIIR